MNANRIPTDAQIAQFRHDGLVFLPGFYDAAETREITAWVDEVAAWPEAPGRHMVYHEDSPLEPGRRMIQRIEDVTPFHPGFEKLFDRGRARGGGAAPGRAGGAVQGQDRFQAARRRRLQGAPGCAGRPGRLCPL